MLDTSSEASAALLVLNITSTIVITASEIQALTETMMAETGQLYASANFCAMAVWSAVVTFLGLPVTTISIDTPNGGGGGEGRGGGGEGGGGGGKGGGGSAAGEPAGTRGG